MECNCVLCSKCVIMNAHVQYIEIFRNSQRIQENRHMVRTELELWWPLRTRRKFIVYTPHHQQLRVYRSRETCISLRQAKGTHTRRIFFAFVHVLCEIESTEAWNHVSSFYSSSPSYVPPSYFHSFSFPSVHSNFPSSLTWNKPFEISVFRCQKSPYVHFLDSAIVAVYDSS